jgi:hypothetical protein
MIEITVFFSVSGILINLLPNTDISQMMGYDG